MLLEDNKQPSLLKLHYLPTYLTTAHLTVANQPLLRLCTYIVSFESTALKEFVTFFLLICKPSYLNVHFGLTYIFFFLFYISGDSKKII